MYAEPTIAGSADAVGAADDDLPYAPLRGRALAAANDESDSGRALAFGAGVAVGALIGAGLALLLAPQSGAATRAFITRGARRIPDRVHDKWDDLGDELRFALRRRGRNLRRKVRQARWDAADMVEG